MQSAAHARRSKTRLCLTIRRYCSSHASEISVPKSGGIIAPRPVHYLRCLDRGRSRTSLSRFNSSQFIYDIAQPWELVLLCCISSWAYTRQSPSWRLNLSRNQISIGKSAKTPQTKSRIIAKLREDTWIMSIIIA
ncbi:hypothetical protein PHLGIDRAFT_430643 [Phlebiopsis gigantea 11061_1 CR5-6]|uniref:Uncharacterized protein n=1 Tax=Phlebiopsis gigantea (strain 11061_1 CR5-6) TaxID=745531 RepID=A0A0C3PL36_PHLG1|nr:hypothetical protein PHLGIDRAFT_430643 [Phlebiopsis gigantea 11061_1 CR5-6]